MPSATRTLLFCSVLGVAACGDPVETTAANDASTSNVDGADRDGSPFGGTPDASVGGLGMGQQDFTSRCAQPGVLRCVAFDADSEIDGRTGDPTGLIPGSLGQAKIDHQTSASGGGSLLFDIPANAPGDPSGSYFANFSDDLKTQFDGGSSFYVQWRQRFSPEWIDTIWKTADDSDTAPKQVIIGTGDRPGCTRSNSLNLEDYPGQGFCAYSCTPLELVTVRNYTHKYPIMYNSCSGSSSHGPYDPFQEPFNGDDFKLQNAMPAPFCTYHKQSDGTDGNCFYYQPNEWMTFQVHVQLGPRVGDEFKNSIVELFVARQGQPSVRVIDWGDTAAGHPAYNLTAELGAQNGNPAIPETYGKVWLVPYMTNKSSTKANPAAKTWYDELIVSSQKIADPT